MAARNARIAFGLMFTLGLALAACGGSAAPVPASKPASVSVAAAPASKPASASAPAAPASSSAPGAVSPAAAPSSVVAAASPSAASSTGAAAQLTVAAAQLTVAALGKSLAGRFACASCHSVDGSASTGPTWKGLYGSQVQLADGRMVTADDAYLHEHIVNPGALLVKGFAPDIMPKDFALKLSPAEIDAIIAYIKTLK